MIREVSHVCLWSSMYPKMLIVVTLVFKAIFHNSDIHKQTLPLVSKCTQRYCL